MHGWGYSPTVETLASNLLGGAVDPLEILRIVGESRVISSSDGFVYLNGDEGLVSKSRERVTSHRLLNGKATSIALGFARDLVRYCPSVNCVALSGSVASGGYSFGDDIDFDIFTPDGTKYLVYGIALLLSLRTTLIHWRSHGFRKLVCINVIWSRTETRPFIRQDEGLAFELLRCQPVVGSEWFDEVIRANGWTLRYFPQLGERIFVNDHRPEPNLVGRLILRITNHPALLTVINRASRAITHAVYELNHFLRHHDPKAVSRIKFLQHVKFPYEVFQD
jgi:hypothetical protein